MGLFWLPAGGQYEIEIHGTGHGFVEVQLLVPKNSQSATIYVFEGLEMAMLSLASLQVTDGPSGLLLENDLDSDGQVDQVLEPVNEVHVPLAKFGLFLPILGGNMGQR